MGPFQIMGSHGLTCPKMRLNTKIWACLGLIVAHIDLRQAKLSDQRLCADPNCSGGSFENLDKHVGDGLEVETDQKMEVIGTKSVLEESPENANELPALETTTNNETSLDDDASDEYEAVEPIIDQTSDNEADNENVTDDQEETIEDISKLQGGGLTNHDM